MRLIRDGEKGVKGVWRWEKRERYAAVTTRMIPALRWPEMRVILMFR